MLHRLSTGDVEAVHRTRVASRRLRELLPLLALDDAGRLGHRLRKVTAELGVVRELDVVMGLLGEADQTDCGEGAALQRVRRAVEAERDGARKRLASRLPKSDLEEIAARLERHMGRLAGERQDRKAGRAPQAWRWAMDARVARRAAEFERAVRGAGAVYMPDRLHAVRIALKKLRYAAELSAEAGSPINRAQRAALKNGQDLLGHLHDLQMLIEWIRRVQASHDVPDAAIEHQLDRCITATDDECRRLHARFMRRRDGLVAVAGQVAARGAVSPSALRRRVAR